MRAAFAEQAKWCDKLGSPFTAELCRLCAHDLDNATATGRKLLAWPGDPSPMTDSLPLRLAGGFHALVLRGAAPELAQTYPPDFADDLAAALASTLRRHDAFLESWIDSPPQTNEVGRAGVLMPGLMQAAIRFGLPIALFELGASGGLNLNLDRFAYDLGGRAAGDPASKVRIAPEWQGLPPMIAKVAISRRQGVDRAPVDPVAQRERLLAYIWADQRERIARTKAALDIAAAHPPRVDRADAADWLEENLALAPEKGVLRVVMHSITYQYFSADTQARVDARIRAAGRRASESGPLAWLRMEKDSLDQGHSLRLMTFPGGEDRLLAYCHAHGSWIAWRG